MSAQHSSQRSLLGALSSLGTKISSPGKLTASLKRRVATLPKRKRIIAASSVVGVVALVVGLLAGGVFGSSHPRVPHKSTPRIPARIVSTFCPLTDLPAPNGVPNRPALAIKIGNEPPPGDARPQSGLNEADIVYDTPAEGFIMRYVAVFQCNNAPSIGPTRSVRWVDWHIVQQFGRPILAFAGGINPDVDTVMGLSWLEPANLLEGAQDAAHRISSREAPDNLYTSTGALYSMFKSDTAPPKPVFSFSAKLPSGAKPAAALAINFSGGTDARWTWSAKAKSFLHGYTQGPDIDASTGQRVSTTNIVVESVHYNFGPYPESPGGSGDVESVTTGSGPGYILRDGLAIAVTWHRASFSSPTTFTDAKGAVVGLAPGRTWVELVPDTTFDAPGAVTITP